jgi:CDP-diacylglycerol pyrophosphatase
LATLAFAIACAASSAWAAQPSATHLPPVSRNQLWHLVHDRCAPAARRGDYPPAPCAEVVDITAPKRGYVVLKDRVGRSQYLTIPLARVPGIESPALLAPDAPNYFADAWTARLYVEAALHRTLPRDALILAVNSAHGRTQDQLHIHVDCIRTDVHDVLAHELPSLTAQWRALERPLPPKGHAYQARWIDGDTLTVNPFQLLHDVLPKDDRMARHSLVVVGARSPAGEPGFILLSGRADASTGDHGSGDELQDHDCAIVRRAP